jgi:hypothetical protein
MDYVAVGIREYWSQDMAYKNMQYGLMRGFDFRL